MTVIVVFLNDVRECRIEGDHLVHVLNSGFRIRRDDPRIIKIK